MKIEWEKYFDKIYCTHYLPYTERKPYIEKELDRVDILNSEVFEWNYTVPNKYYDYVFLSKKNFKNHNNTAYNNTLNNNVNPDTPEATESDIDYRFINNTNINLTINMIDLLYQSQNKGFKKVLFLEDDVFFLRDKSLIKMILENIPQDYDVINFDPFIYDLNKYKPDVKTGMYVDVSTSEVYNGSCILLNKKAIDYILIREEQMLLPWDNYITCKDTNKWDGIKRYIPFVNICIQRDYTIRQEYFYENTKYSKYKYMDNVKLENYAPVEKELNEKGNKQTV